MYTIKFNNQILTYEKKPLLITDMTRIIIQEDLLHSKSYPITDTITITITKTN